MPPQGQFFTGPGSTEPGSQGAEPDVFGDYDQPDTDALARRQPGTGVVHPRQPQARLIAPGGRHRRPMPASLPEGAPALVLAVPNVGDDSLTGPTADIATVLRVDNPALDVRTARIDHAGRGNPYGYGRCWPTRRPGAPQAHLRPWWCRRW